MAYTLQEFQKSVKDPVLKGVIKTIFTTKAFLQYVMFRNIAGLAYAYARNEVLPQVNFRKLNEASVGVQGVTNRYVEALKILSGDSDTDVELIQAYGREERTSRDELFLTAMAQKFCQFFFYGNCGARVVGSPYDDDDGFDGLIPRLSSGQTVDATGTSATAGSSVFAVKFGMPYCMGLQSHDITAKDFGECEDEPVERLRVAWTPGVAIFHGKSVGRIKNLDTTKTLECDMMDELKGKITGRRPSCYVMSDRSHRQLKDDAKTAGISLAMTLNSLGQDVESWDGVPIVIDDEVIVDTENNTV